ncbi:MAG: MraY family glycosyltransferase, partial [Myxococcota bacterium]
SSMGQRLFEQPWLVFGLVMGGGAAAILGALDDLRGVRALHKLGTQTAIAGLAYAAGFRIDAVALPWVGAVELGVLAIPATMLWFVAVMNAVNLIDGLDGLAAGIAFIACISNFVVGWMNDALLVVLLSAALAGAVLGFLIYNFNPASIFMGDTGSLFLGFVLAATSLLGSSIKSSTTVSLLVPILALGVPIMDTLFAMVRRWLERRPIFAPDRGHIHHKLLDLGLTHRRAVLTLYAVSTAFAVGAVAVALGKNWEVGGALIAVVVVIVGFVKAARLFAGVRLRREQNPYRSPFVEAMSREIVRALQDLGAAPERPDALRSLERFLERAEVSFARIAAPEFSWTFGEPGANRALMRVEVRSSVANGVSGTFEYLDEWSVSRPQAELLLRLVVDGLTPHLPDGDEGLERADSRKLVPARTN